MQCVNIAPINREETVNNPKDVLTEQELDHLVELDMSSQGELAGGTNPVTVSIAVASAVSTTAIGVGTLIMATATDPCPSSACTTRC